MLTVKKTRHVREDGVPYWEIELRTDRGHVSPCHDGGPLLVFEENTILEDMIRRVLKTEALLMAPSTVKVVRLVRDIVETLHFDNLK